MFIKLLKSMLLASGRIFETQSGTGICAVGLNPDTLDIEALLKAVTDESPTLTATLFPESKKYDSKTDSLKVTPEMIWIGPANAKTLSDDDISDILNLSK